MPPSDETISNQIILVKTYLPLPECFAIQCFQQDNFHSFQNNTEMVKDTENQWDLNATEKPVV